MIPVSMIIIYILHSYGNIKTIPYYVQFIVFISWVFPFFGFILLTSDIASSKYTKCISNKGNCEMPLLYLTRDELYIVWLIMYWNTFFLTWFIIPFIQHFLSQGGFNNKKKINKTLRYYFYIFSIMFILAIMGIIYLSFIGYNTRYITIHITYIKRCYTITNSICF